jgi:hypothetical protein
VLGIGATDELFDVYMSKNSEAVRCCMMSGPDSSMDQFGDSLKPANPMSIKCPHCTMPDINSVPQPYFLVKGMASPMEISSAQMGNFLVRDRVRQILEIAVPKACEFLPTTDKKTKKQTPWSLVVPRMIIETPGMKRSSPVCVQCGEPKLGYSYQNSVWDQMKRFDTKGVDVFKSAGWYANNTAEDAFKETNQFRKEVNEPPLAWSDWGVSPPSHPQRWTRLMVGRDLYFSIRLEQLCKQARVKGDLVRSYDFKNVQRTPRDDEWIAANLRLLAEHGLVDAPKSSSPIKPKEATDLWMEKYISKHASRRTPAIDFDSIEKRNTMSLPQDYKLFIFKIGCKAFTNVSDMVGSRTIILPADQLDFKTYRRGKVKGLGDDDAEVDGVAFAEMDNGDCFVFDVSVKTGEYPVYWYRHEENTMEAFAANFAECVKRFVEKD